MQPREQLFKKAINELSGPSAVLPADVYLMEKPVNGKFRISDNNNLYLYKDSKNKVFYLIQEGQQKQSPQYYIDHKDKKLQFGSELFNSSICNNKELVQAVLEYTSKRGHIFTTPMVKVDDVEGYYDLELMLNLPGNDKNNAVNNKIYLSSDNGGTYVVRDAKGEVQEGSLKHIDLSDLNNRLNEGTFKRNILKIISEAGHIQVEYCIIKNSIKNKNQFYAINLNKIIGKGAYGTACKAYHLMDDGSFEQDKNTNRDREFVAKIYHDRKNLDIIKDLADREAMNFVRYYRKITSFTLLDRADNQVYFVMEFLPGKQLFVEEESELFLMSTPKGDDCFKISDRYQLYLYKDADNHVFYKFNEDKVTKTFYLDVPYLNNENNEKFNSEKCDNQELIQSVLKITKKSGHTGKIIKLHEDIKNLDFPGRIKVLCGLADIFNLLHGQLMIHGDVKHENLLFVKETFLAPCSLLYTNYTKEDFSKITAGYKTAYIIAESVTGYQLYFLYQGTTVELELENPLNYSSLDTLIKSLNIEVKREGVTKKNLTMALDDIKAIQETMNNETKIRTFKKIIGEDESALGQYILEQVRVILNRNEKYIKPLKSAAQEFLDYHAKGLGLNTKDLAWYQTVSNLRCDSIRNCFRPDILRLLNLLNVSEILNLIREEDISKSLDEVIQKLSLIAKVLKLPLAEVLKLPLAEVQKELAEVQKSQQTNKDEIINKIIIDLIPCLSKEQIMSIRNITTFIHPEKIQIHIHPLDFGLSRVLPLPPKRERFNHNEIFPSDQIIGSLLYLAPEVLEGYDLELMSNLPGNDNVNAVSNKIYLSADNGGTYVVRDTKGEIQKGSLKNINLSNLTNSLNNEDNEVLRNNILEITSEAGHTISKNKINLKCDIYALTPLFILILGGIDPFLQKDRAYEREMKDRAYEGEMQKRKTPYQINKVNKAVVTEAYIYDGTFTDKAKPNEEYSFLKQYLTLLLDKMQSQDHMQRPEVVRMMIPFLYTIRSFCNLFHPDGDRELNFLLKKKLLAKLILLFWGRGEKENLDKIDRQQEFKHKGLCDLIIQLRFPGIDINNLTALNSIQLNSLGIVEQPQNIKHLQYLLKCSEFINYESIDLAESFNKIEALPAKIINILDKNYPFCEEDLRKLTILNKLELLDAIVSNKDAIQPLFNDNYIKKQVISSLFEPLNAYIASKEKFKKRHPGVEHESMFIFDIGGIPIATKLRAVEELMNAIKAWKFDPLLQNKPLLAALEQGTLETIVSPFLAYFRAKRELAAQSGASRPSPSTQGSVSSQG